ncbi:MAG: hypothetical protein H7328_09920 [Bdellovibrio sp.]|nr:hypothetical protein [Bdellovibrio sp.]
MKTSRTTAFILIFILGFFAQANEIFFSLSTELQSFYLNPQNSANLFGRVELQSKGDYQLFPSLKFKIDASVNSTFLNKQEKSQPVLFNPKQFGFNYSNSLLELQLGGFTVTPDGADLNNIFDVVHGKDYRNPFNSKSIGSIGLLSTFSMEPFTVKLFYIPKNTKSLLPDLDSPWWPHTETLPIRNSSGTFYVTDKMSYVYKSENNYEKPFDNNFGASVKSSFSHFDFYLFYFSGANQMPKVSADFNIDVTSFNPLIGSIKPPVELNLNWYRSDHAGAGVTAVVYDWIGKVFCKQQTDYLIQKEYSPACTFSLENSFPIGSASVHYFLQNNRVWRQSDVASELETLLGFFEKSTALGYLVDMSSNGLVSGAFVYNERNPSWLANLGYEYRFTDQFRAKLNLNQIFSTQDIIGKAYDKADNASIQITYDF